MSRPKSKDPIKASWLHLRVTAGELQELRELARRNGGNISDVARARIFADSFSGQKPRTSAGAKS